MEKKLITQWNQIMGEVIGNRTIRLYIREKVLYVTLSSAPLKHQLIQSKDMVMERLIEELGEKVIEDIRFL